MADQKQFGAFIPTTDVFDISQIQNLDPSSVEYKQFIVSISNAINSIALLLNIKDSGYYLPTEFVNGQLWFSNQSTTTIEPLNLRQVFRMVVDFGALPNTAEKSVAHNITDISSAYSFTRMYAVASDTTGMNYIPIPYASPTLANNISLRADATNVYIETGSDRTAFNKCYVVLEYLTS